MLRRLAIVPARFAVPAATARAFTTASSGTSTSTTAKKTAGTSTNYTSSKPAYGAAKSSFKSTSSTTSTPSITNKDIGAMEPIVGEGATPGEPVDTAMDWINSKEYYGVSVAPFSEKTIDVLLAPIDKADIEIKPDGLLYLPEIKYRRILNRAFGPGGWAVIPRGPYSQHDNTLSREYAMLCLGRFVSQARGEQDMLFGDGGLATATEGVKSNALMRCCKDLGIASELWDPAFISVYKKENCVSEWCTHATKGTKKLLWRKKNRSFDYPWATK